MDNGGQLTQPETLKRAPIQHVESWLVPKPECSILNDTQDMDITRGALQGFRQLAATLVLSERRVPIHT